MISRNEHPKPQFERKNWENLNGKWDFAFDRGTSGEARGMHLDDAVYPLSINVPFCPQSKLSGIAETDFMNSIWYRRRFNVTADKLNGKVMLHFGAVDYRTVVYVNGQKVGGHKGGYVSFSMDITPCVKEGENVLVVNALDDERDRLIPTGKQCLRYKSGGAHYTRTTGIWQTVWLEFLPQNHIVKAKYYPDVATSTISISLHLSGKSDLNVSTSFNGKETGSVSLKDACGQVNVSIPLTEVHLWELGKGGLYDLNLTFGDDEVRSYFGLRSIQYTDYKFLLNGKSVFQRLVLDQGFYPDGIYTAPSDEELLADIDRSMALGFNGARLHQKVFEERFLYHADRKGYMVWGEYADWGLDHSYPDAIYGILPEWLEVLERDFNHPSIVGWCPFNETFNQNGRQQFNELISTVYRVTKSVDPTRPCIDVSGFYHVLAPEIYDVHDYAQDPKEFASHYENAFKDGTVIDSNSNGRQRYDGKKCFFVSEYGGILWSDKKTGWGYGDAPKTEEEFLTRLKGLTDVLLDNPKMFGFCYTQLTDVEQEQNGLYAYDRNPKFDVEVIHRIFAKKAAIED